jgi:hypothetical protein
MTSALMVRLDAESKAYIARAARLRRISISECVRTVLVAAARREVQASTSRIIMLSLEDQLAFWVTVHGSRVTSVQERIEPQKSFSGASVDPADACLWNDRAQQRPPPQ